MFVWNAGIAGLARGGGGSSYEVKSDSIRNVLLSPKVIQLGRCMIKLSKNSLLKCSSLEDSLDIILSFTLHRSKVAC